MLKSIAFRAASRFVLHPWFRLTRGLTLGARALVIDETGKFLLVRHSYAPGWLLPGGGVETGETAYDAVKREVREETGVISEEEPQLHGLFANHEQFFGDHVACFVIRRFRRESFTSTAEIAETGFFAGDDLPELATSGT